MHIPVLAHEVLEYLHPRPGDSVIDATINGGGHAFQLAERIGVTGKLFGIDRDKELVRKSQFVVVCDSFANIRKIAEDHGFINVDSILFDLGFSSFHVESSGRGFSFLSDETLDMRYDTDSELSARDIVNQWPEDAIAQVLYEYGEERFSRRIARGMREARKVHAITKTGELVEIIRRAVPMRYRKGRLHFATRTFQALRIAVNNELEHITCGVRDAIELLRPGGRICVISFHSLEDRIIKKLFLEKRKETMLSIITKKPITPSKREIRDNPRSRSAKMRVAERTSLSCVTPSV